MKETKKKNVKERQKWEENKVKEKQQIEKNDLDKRHREEMAETKKRHNEEVDELENRLGNRAGNSKRPEEEQKTLIALKEIVKNLVKDLEKLDNETHETGDMETARKEFECPVCMEMMKPPTRIWMCSASHLVCEVL